MKFRISELHHIDKVNDAPNHSGLYVWYGKLTLGAADWDERVIQSNSIAHNQLLNALRDHSFKHRQQPLELEALANFSTKWTGSLDYQRPDAWDDETDGFWSEKSDNFISHSTSTNLARENLLNFLDDAFPKFCSPLYIGLAIDQSLRSRLIQHRHKLRRHWEAVCKDTEYSSRIKGDDFAERAIKVGFSPRDLFFYTLHIETTTDESSSVQQTELLRSAEWLLNRWANPILGRR
jgi:hypothetical protein